MDSTAMPDTQADAPQAPQDLVYERDERVARITLNRPEHGNGITRTMVRQLEEAVERANLDPKVHVIALSGRGEGFCGGYDFIELGQSIEQRGSDGAGDVLDDSPVDPRVIIANHDPSSNWDPIVDYQFMWRNVRAFMALFNSDKPVICKIHGFCVAAGTDLALCSDLIVVDDDAKIGYPPARVWGSPTSAMWAVRLGPARAKRLLFTGDSINGREAVEWGLAIESAPRERVDERFETLVQRVARLPISQLVMQKLIVNQALYAQGLHASQVLGTIFDGIARHTNEGHGFVTNIAQHGWREAVRLRDEPFGDLGSSTFKG